MYDKGILSEKVAEDVRQMILDKNLKPGDKLPNEIDLAALINVSRSTIREAIKILVSTNVLTVRRGLGTFVSETPGIAKDPLGVHFMEEENLLKHFFEMRMLIEPQMVAIAVVRGTDKEIRAIESAYDDVVALLNKGVNHTEADIAFHNSIAKATHNPIMERILPIINNGIVGGYSKTKDSPESAEEVYSQHKKIMDAIRNKDMKAAEKAMSEHISYGLERSRKYKD